MCVADGEEARGERQQQTVAVYYKCDCYTWIFTHTGIHVGITIMTIYIPYILGSDSVAMAA